MRVPNVLIFMTDHQRGDTVLPEHPALTPNVEALAREGVTFSEAYCTAPHCCPARASFHSGLYPSGHGVWNNVCNDQALTRGLKAGVRLWSEDLAKAGYRLVHSGKWHVSAEEWPRDRGWRDELLVSGGPGALHGDKWDYYRELASRPDPAERGEGEILRPGYGTYRTYGVRERNDHDEEAVAKAIETLPRIASAGEPWCLYVGAQGPHDPYLVPGRYLDMYDPEEVRLPASYRDDMTGKPAVVRRMREQIWDQLTEREVREAIRHFRAYCTYLDDLFGRLMRALELSGGTENTLVLYCADHGDYCGDHGLFAKGIPPYRGAYHVPAVVRWPAGIRNPGRRLEELVSLVDFAPTFLELAGVETDRRFAGASLVPFLRDERPREWRDDLFCQCNGVELYYTQRIVFTKTHKYVFNGFDRDELYDLKKDPDEMTNVADDPAQADVKRDLVGRLWRHAHSEGDGAASRYITVGLAPWGPAEAFR